jgi:hypothetical protein
MPKASTSDEDGEITESEIPNKKGSGMRAKIRRFVVVDSRKGHSICLYVSSATHDLIGIVNCIAGQLEPTGIKALIRMACAPLATPLFTRSEVQYTTKAKERIA